MLITINICKRCLVIRNAQCQRENIVRVEKQLSPRRGQKVAGEVDEKGMSSIKPKDVSVIVWGEPSMKPAMGNCIATANLLNLVSRTELTFLQLM